MYFLTVSLCMPSSRAIPRMDSPLRFAFCTAFHLAVCSGVGFLSRCVAFYELFQHRRDRRWRWDARHRGWRPESPAWPPIFCPDRWWADG